MIECKFMPTVHLLASWTQRLLIWKFQKCQGTNQKLGKRQELKNLVREKVIITNFMCETVSVLSRLLHILSVVRIFFAYYCECK